MTARRTLTSFMTDLEHLASLERGNVAATALEKAQMARGIDTAVDTFVKREMPERKDKNGKVTQNVNAPHMKIVSTGTRVEAPHALARALAAVPASERGRGVPIFEGQTNAKTGLMGYARGCLGGTGSHLAVSAHRQRDHLQAHQDGEGLYQFRLCCASLVKRDWTLDDAILSWQG